MVEAIKLRTKAIAIEAIRISGVIPNSHAGHVITRQLIRCGTAVGSNYRAAIRAKSTADYINKLKIVEEEADETIYWIELLEECNLVKSTEAIWLKTETTEILSIIVATIKKLRLKIKNHPSSVVNRKS